jgi:hypothetical protein
MLTHQNGGASPVRDDVDVGIVSGTPIKHLMGDFLKEKNVNIVISTEGTKHPNPRC